MNIAIDAREATGAIAGKGRYIAETIKSLAVIDQDNQYFLYTKSPLSLIVAKNFHEVRIGGLPLLRQLWMALDVKKRGCTLLFAPTGYLPVAFSLVPCIVTIHDLALFVTKDAKPSLRTLLAEKLLLGLAVKKAKKILAVSQNTADDLVQLFRTPKEKISVTPLGYDAIRYTPKKSNDTEVLEKYHLKQDYLLFVGTLEPRKNLVRLIEAYGQLDPLLRQSHPLVIGGKKGWYYEEIFATVARLGLEKEITFLGRVEDSELPALYRNAKLFLFPSIYEGFGLPLLEALACGTPVLSSNNSSLIEVVGEAGLLIDPYQTKQISEGIVTLLQDPKKYALLAEKTTEQAAKFSWQKTATQTLNAFQEL